MRQIIFILNLLGLAISCSYFLFGFDLLSNDFGSLVSHFTLGVFQSIFSLVLIFQRKKTNRFLDLHFLIAFLYLFFFLIARFLHYSNDGDFALGNIPCFIAILFTIGLAKWTFSPNQIKTEVEEKTTNG